MKHVPYMKPWIVAKVTIHSGQSQVSLAQVCCLTFNIAVIFHALESPLMRATLTQAVADLSGGLVSCKKCASLRQQDFQGELSVAFPGTERLNLSPIYICQRTLVCLDCGFTELVFPPTELEKLRKGMEALHSNSETAE